MNLNNFLTFFSSKFIFPAYHIFKKNNSWEIIKQYENSQWLSHEELKQLQQKKLSTLLKHCNENVPYYRNIFKQTGLSPKDLTDYASFSKLPFLTKQIINNNRNKLKATKTVSSLIPNSTSGSTGETLYFYQCQYSALHRQATVCRTQNWAHCLYTDKEAHLWGARFDEKKSKSFSVWLRSRFKRSIFLSAYDLSDQMMFRYVNILNTFKPKLLIAYPSALTLFADFLTRTELKIPSIQSIITSAEKLYLWQKEIIMQAINCEIYDRYGCREFGCIAQECDKHEGYHVNCERFFLEILGEDNKPVGPEQIGEIVITDLDNFGFPLIRYKMKDMCILSDRMCSCGRGLPLIKSIEGRSFDIIVTPRGNRIGGTFWTIALRSVQGVKAFQIIQNNISSITLKIVKTPSYSVQTEHKIIQMITEKCGDEIKIDIHYVDAIPLTKSGKRRFVISNVIETYCP